MPSTFDDLIALTGPPARTTPLCVIRTRWRRRLKLPLVDEYQDPTQRFPVKPLAAPGWSAMSALIDRGGPTTISRFTAGAGSTGRQNLSGLKIGLSQPARGQAGTELPLGRQRFSKRPNAVIACNPHDVRKNTCGASTVPATICASSSTNDDQRRGTKGIARDILTLFHGGRARWGECAVL